MQRIRPVTKPNKQRKMLYQAPDHVRRKLLAAHLSSELRATHGARQFPLRTGDTVRVMRGDHEGVEGKIARVDRQKYRVYVEGLTREKVDGSTISVSVHPSKVMITRLNLDDKLRKEALERKRQKKAEKVEAVPEVKVEKPVEAPAVKEMAEEKPLPEEVPAVEEKPKKRALRARRKVAEKPAKPKAAEKPKAEKKRTRRKTTKKAEEGEE